MASQGTHPQNINDFDFLTYDSTLGDGSLNTTSDSLNDTFVNVHFQQHEYDHDGGQNVQSDCNHWHGPTAESIALDNDVVSGLLTEALFGTFCVRYRGTGYTLLLYSRHSTE